MRSSTLRVYLNGPGLRTSLDEFVRIVSDGKADAAWTGLEKRIDAQRSALKLAGSSKLSKSALSKAIGKGGER